MDRVRIGVLGAGAISGIYFENLTKEFENVTVAAVCDICREKADAAAKKYGIKKVYGKMEELFADDEVEIVLNLTRPNEHFETTKAALLAGKHVYSEKPLAATFAQGEELAAFAKARHLLLGGAPDTFLGAGIQTCRKLIESGLIGSVVGAEARMLCHGHESWHPAPEFYYQRGGGPMMDMGPYYITALVYLMGGVKEICAMGQKSFPMRTITSQPLRGKEITVEVPTHTVGILKFTSGAIGTITTSFDVFYDNQAFLELYGTKGTLRVPDPNGFGGPVSLFRPEEGRFMEMPLLFGHAENSRGLGLSGMADALRTGGKFAADVHQTLHVLEILTSFEKSSDTKSFVRLRTGYEGK